MADEPFFKAGTRINLGVELKRQDVAINREALRCAKRRCCQIGRFPRGFEGIAMPMQHGDALKMPQWSEPSRIGQRQFRKADFLVAHRLDIGAECSSDLLRSEADAEDRPPRVKSMADQGPFLDKKGIGLGFVN